MRLRLWGISLLLLIILFCTSSLKAENYNQLPSPQFRMVPLGNPQEMVFNGGIGNGSRLAYFCGGFDEANFYSRLNGLSLLTASPNEGPANKGTYQFVGIQDRCHTGEFQCGDLPIHNRHTVFGYPKFATNCHMMGPRIFFDNSSVQENPREFGTPLGPRGADPHYPKWRDRNFIDDGYGFIYGRYIVQRLGNPDWSDPPNVPIGTQADVESISRPGEYQVLKYQGAALDIPFQPHHLQYGFTCPLISKSHGYRSNPKLETEPFPSLKLIEPRAVDRERRDYYLHLLGLARDRIGSLIAQGVYYGEERNPLALGGFGLGGQPRVRLGGQEALRKAPGIKRCVRLWFTPGTFWTK